MKTRDSKDLPFNQHLYYPRYFNWDQSVNAGEGGWIEDIPGPPAIAYSSTSRRRITHSNNAWEEPNMQDYILEHWSTELTPLSEFSLDSGLQDHGDDTLRYIHLSTSIGRCTEIHTDFVVSHLIGNDSLPFNPSRVLRVGEVLYQRLGKTQFTRSVDIRKKDPFDKDFSLWYLIVDLSELPRLANQIRKSLKLIARLRSNRPFRDIASDHLAIQFGILPTIADIKDFISIVQRWALHVQSEEEIGKEFFTFHAPVKELGRNEYTEPYFLDFATRAQFIAHVRFACVHKLYQTTKFYFVYPELSGVLSRLRQLTDLLGLLDPTVIWDLIPWSFVIDWIADISSWVHQNLKPRLFPASLVICDWAESVHTDCTVSGSFDYAIANPNGLTNPRGSGNISGNYYGIVRKRQFPKPLTIGTQGLLTPDSIINIRRVFIGAALVTQRGRVKQRRKATDYHRR